jgi:hypothetical protein
MPRRSIPDELIERARVLVFDQCLTWNAAARELGLSTSEGIRRHLDPKYRLKRNEQIAASAKRRYHENFSSLGHHKRRPELIPLPRGAYHRGPGNVIHSSPRAPAHVLEEAERVRAAELTLSMHYFGDPPPGRSALDRTRGA